MFAYLLIEGVLIGIMIAVPVGPLGLLCINRALTTGALCGLVSGLGVASADALVAGIVALGVSLISGFLIEHQFLLRLVGGVLLWGKDLHHKTKAGTAAKQCQRLIWNLRHDVSPDPFQSGYGSTVYRHLCRLGGNELERPLFCRGNFDARRIYRLCLLVDCTVRWLNHVSPQIHT